MLKTIFIALLSFNVLFSNGSDNLITEKSQNAPKAETGTMEKMIVANGSVAMNLDLNRLNGSRSRSQVSRSNELRFDVERNSFFTIIVFNDELRGALPSSMRIIPQTSASLPSKLDASYQNLVIENTMPGDQYGLVIRDGKTGFVFFNIEGYQFDYNAFGRMLNIQTGRLLISQEFAAALGRSSEVGTVVGELSVSAYLRPIEVTEIVNGEIVGDDMPAIGDPEAGTVPGPDVVVGDVVGLAQFGSSSGTQVGLALGTTSCNFGTVDLNWFQLPNNDHPVIPQNLYRMSGGANNNERFEQIGQSSVKHAFTALIQNLCGLGCNNVGGSKLGSGCSDPYTASLNSGPNLGSRAWINPFTGFYPRGDSATPPNSHTGHSHTGPSHRILTEMSDLTPVTNSGATYYAESQYVTPHEFVWCQANPTQCNMYNNVAYRQYTVSGNGSPFSFSPVGATQREKTAITAWSGASVVGFQPAPGVDGIGSVGYKVTNPSPGVWHYEYAVYNQNLDRAIQSFSVPTDADVTLSNIGFHAPPQHPGWSNDGTMGNAGFSSAPWTQTQTANLMTWSSETLAQNPNANAIRWGTMYNFRFDSNRPPKITNATVGFLKTGNPITVQVQGPAASVAASVTVAGRVINSGNVGIANAIVSLTDSTGNVVAAVRTTSFGFYRFEDVSLGTYTISVSARRYSFSSQTLQVTENISGVDFISPL